MSQSLATRPGRKASGAWSICGKVQSLRLRDGTPHRAWFSYLYVCWLLPAARNNHFFERNFYVVWIERQLTIIIIAAPGVGGPDTRPHHSSISPGYLIKHIPMPTRVQLSKLLTDSLGRIRADSDCIARWWNLFNVGRNILSQPQRGSRYHEVSQRLSDHSEVCDKLWWSW